MSIFSDAVQDFYAALAGLPGEDLRTRVNGLLQASQKATPQEVNWATAPLVELIARSRVPHPAPLGIVGDLVCRGASFWGVIPHLLGGIRQHLRLAHRFIDEIQPRLPAGKRFRELGQEEMASLVATLSDEQKERLRSWDFLGFVAGPSMPLFEQVKPFRQLARAMGLDVAWLRQGDTAVDWLPQLPQMLDDQQSADGPLPEPTAAIDAALANIRKGASGPPSMPGSVRKTIAPLFEATTFPAPEELSRAGAELARITATADPSWLGDLANACGGFVELGADPEPGADALMRRLPQLVDDAVAFVRACQARQVKEGESAVQVHAEEVGVEMPDEALSVQAINWYSLGIIAHLARSAAARQRFGHQPDLLGKLDVIRWETSNTGYLWKMLQVLDDHELVVLSPAHQLGWSVKIGGIGDNFQLHALIGGHLVGALEQGKYPGRIGTHADKPEPGPGVPLSARAIATQTDAPCMGQEPGFTSHLQLWNWTALQKDGTLPANPISAHEHFIWNEGIPADIAPFEGTRIVLLGDTTIQRSWNGGRIFPFMRASFRVDRTLTAEEASGWLTRIAAKQ
jgi:hypothetical protein